MKSQILIFSFLLFFSFFLYAQGWPGVFIICAISFWFSRLVLVLGLFFFLKIVYNLIFSKGEPSEIFSSKKALAFLLLGLALAMFFAFFLNTFLQMNIC
ncbi:MAG: hypothetical protein ACPLZH_00140 [Minisyncoccales bacterium]